jgi:hypothetical protein
MMWRPTPYPLPEGGVFLIEGSRLRRSPSNSQMGRGWDGEHAHVKR